jgi:subtilase family serine protease
MLIGQTQTFSNGTYYDEFRIGGTSLSSPLMAGMLAVAQELHGGKAFGLANYALYSLSPSVYHDVVDTADPAAVVRVDYYNSQDASNGLLYSIRRSNATWTLHTVAGYDDVTGLGTPTAAFFSALAATK